MFPVDLFKSLQGQVATQSEGSPEENKLALFENAELAGDDIPMPSCPGPAIQSSGLIQAVYYVRVRCTQTTLHNSSASGPSE